MFQYLLSYVECSLLKTFNTLQKYLMFVCYVRIHVAWSCSVQFCFANDFISRGPFSRGAIILSLKTVSGGYLYWLGPHYLFTLSIFWLYIVWRKWAWQINSCPCQNLPFDFAYLCNLPTNQSGNFTAHKCTSVNRNKCVSSITDLKF